MLYFYEDKMLVKPFDTIWRAIDSFLELADPDGRQLTGIHLRQQAPIPRIRLITRIASRFQGIDPLQEAHHDAWNRGQDINAWFDGTAERQRRIEEAELQAKEVWNDPRFEVALYWDRVNITAPQAQDLTPYDVRRRLAICTTKTNPNPRMVGVFFYLLTPFDAVDEAFLSFHAEAERRLPFRLQPARWRQAILTSRGTTVLRKIRNWPGD